MLVSIRIIAVITCLILTPTSLVYSQALDGVPPKTSERDSSRTDSPGVPELRARANKAYTEQDYVAFRNAMVELHRQRPNNTEYMYQLVLAHALLNDKQAAYNIMLLMQRQGLNYDFNQAPESQSIRSTQVYSYLNELLVNAGKPVGMVESAAVIPENFLIPEAIAWDAQREAFIVGTVTDGQILQVGRDGDITELVRADKENGIWGIYGLSVDAGRNRLWASSAATRSFSGFDPIDQGRSMLLEFELDSMTLLNRYPVPVDGKPHNLGNLVVGPDGTVYVADSIIPVIYKLDSGAPRLEPFFGARNLVNLRGLDISPDGRLLYFADYEMGINIIDLQEKKSGPLVVPEDLNLGGIDGLSFWENHLIVVQSGISPERVMRLKLDPSRTSVEEIAPLAVAQDIFEMPTYGTVVGDEFFFFANSHWSAPKVRPTTIAKVKIDDAAAITDPNVDRLMENFMQNRRASQEQQDPPGNN